LPVASKQQTPFSMKKQRLCSRNKEFGNCFDTEDMKEGVSAFWKREKLISKEIIFSPAIHYMKSVI
jgi:hypothetical protein